ncbi:MAG: hypothetical protein D6818_05065 [Bacteroidetes bacterium]|nr:MAG: hypothetical protein D6818_05065 [Bacteroidota bacterium]
MPPPSITELKDTLSLTDEQVQQLQSLEEAHRQAMDALRKDTSLDPEARREQMKALRDQFRQDIGEILSPEQLELLRSLRPPRGERRPRPPRGKQGPEPPDEALRQEVRQYRQAHIQPVLQAQRAKLEPRLAEADRQELARLREVFRQMKKERDGILAQAKAEKRRPNEAERDRLKALHEAHEADFEALRALVERYRDDIDALMEEIAPQREKWEADLAAIHEKYRPEGEMPPPPPDEAHPPRKGHRPPEGKRAEGKEDRPPRHGHHGLPPEARFLLMDAAGETGAALPATVKMVKVQPNPVQDEARLTFSLATEADVRVELRDPNGQVVRVLQDSRLPAGEHALTFEAADLQTGPWYVAVIANGYRLSAKFIVAR